jgi:hypothetical protein
LHREKGIQVGSYVKASPTDVDYPFSLVMLDKIYDITGYLCGHRIYNMLQKNGLKTDYKVVFEEHQKSSRFPNGGIAVLAGLPATTLYFVNIRKVCIIQGRATSSLSKLLTVRRSCWSCQTEEIL